MLCNCFILFQPFLVEIEPQRGSFDSLGPFLQATQDWNLPLVPQIV